MSYLTTGSQSLIDSLDDGATWVQAGYWALAALSQLIIIDLEEGQNKLVEVRDDQTKLLIYGTAVSPCFMPCKALQNQG